MKTITRKRALELLLGMSKKNKFNSLTDRELEELLRVISEIAFEVKGD